MEKLRKIILLYLIGGEAGAKSITAQYLAYHLQYQGSLHDIDRAKILLILIDHVKKFHPILWKIFGIIHCFSKNFQLIFMLVVYSILVAYIMSQISKI